MCWRGRHCAGLRPASAPAHRGVLPPGHDQTTMPFALDVPTALIPIDVQQEFDMDASSNPAMEANGLRLLAAWRASGRPLIHVRHDSVQPGSPFRPGQPGNPLRPGFEPRAGEPLVSKSVNAAFIGTDLDLRLRRLGVQQVVLFGMTTDMCVSTSARVAANLGYRTVVVGDATACFRIPWRGSDQSDTTVSGNAASR